MVRRAPVPDDLPPLLAAIRARIAGVQGIWLFGSLARGSARPDSDIDLALLASAPIDPVELFDVGLDLGVLANRDVDLVDLRRASVLLRHIVVTEGRLLETTDAEACAVFAAETAALVGATRDELQIARRSMRGSA